MNITGKGFPQYQLVKDAGKSDLDGRKSRAHRSLSGAPTL
jgi:hypothetical protein